MPTAPKLERRIERDIGQPVYDTTSATAASFGYESARDISRLGETIAGTAKPFLESAELVTQQKRIDDSLLAKDAFTKAANELVFAKDKALSVKDTEGLTGLLDTTSASFLKIKDNYQKVLKNDYQKQLFDASFSEAVTQNLEQVATYKRKMTIEKMKELRVAQNNLATQAAVGSSDYKVWANHAQKIEQNTRANYADTDKEIQDYYVAEEKSRFYSAIIQSIANQSPVEAKAALAQKLPDGSMVKDNIIGANEYEKKIEGLADLEITQNIANRISSATPSLAEQLKLVDKEKGLTPTLITDIKKQLKYINEEKIIATKEQQVTERRRAVEQIFKDPYQKITSTTINSTLFDDPRQEYVALETFRQKIIKGVNAATNWEVYGKLINLDKKQLANANLLKYSDQLASTELKEMFKKQADARDGKSILTPKQFVSDRVRTNPDFALTKKKASISQRYSRLMEQFDMAYSRLSDAEKQSPEAWGKVMDNLLEPIDPGLFSREFYRFELPYKDEKEKADLLSNIPKSLEKYSLDAVSYSTNDNLYYVAGPNNTRLVYDSAGNFVGRQMYKSNEVGLK